MLGLRYLQRQYLWICLSAPIYLQPPDQYFWPFCDDSRWCRLVKNLGHPFTHALLRSNKWHCLPVLAVFLQTGVLSVVHLVPIFCNFFFFFLLVMLLFKMAPSKVHLFLIHSFFLLLICSVTIYGLFAEGKALYWVLIEGDRAFNFIDLIV